MRNWEDARGVEEIAPQIERKRKTKETSAVRDKPKFSTAGRVLAEAVT